MQIGPVNVEDRIDISFMFKTGQNRGLLLYMSDTPGKFYYISLAIFDGALELKVFPQYEISTAEVGEKPVLYNDNLWHTATISITRDNIMLHTDDHNLFQ